METLIPRIYATPASSFFLFGPRGTGKTTFLQQKFPDALWVDLLQPDVYHQYLIHPERLREVVMGNANKKTIIIDEIQKAPELLSVVHFLIEKKLGLQFILTGSSTRKLKKNGTDLLAGRALNTTLHPFLAGELKTNFNLTNALQHGLLPLVIHSPDPVSVLKTYVSMYIREEVLMEGLVRNIGNFARFLESISFSHGSVLNVSNVARECMVERKVVEGYLSVLEDLLFSFRVPIFSKRAKRALTSHPKFYFFDTGVYRSIRPAGPLDKPGEIEGTALEGLVAQHLCAWNAYGGDNGRLFYWRTASGSEVDFIMYGSAVFWAIEVKNTSRIRPEDLRSIYTFKTDFPECRAFFLYRGTEKIMKNNVLCMPIEEFLCNLLPQSDINL